MATIYRIRQILDEIEELRRELNVGVEAWEEGTDECAMAECDPSDHYVIDQEIETLVKELKQLVSEM